MLAAGAGNRFGSNKPKQFCELQKNFTVLEKSFETVSRFAQKIILTLPSLEDESHEVVQRIFFKAHENNCELKICAGGETRQASVQNALQLVESEYVFVHDSARCFVNASDVSNLLERTVLCKAAILAAKATDTIKFVNPNLQVKKTLERSSLWAAQTPQAFQTLILKKAFEHAAKIDFTGTDDASLVEALGELVHIVEAQFPNPKITYEQDLLVYKYLY